MKNIMIYILSAIAVFSPTQIFARIPNDPYATQWGYEHVGLYDAWDYATGSSDVIVAVIDNGFDTFHPDLRDNVWKNVDEIPDNGIDDDDNGYIDDVYGWNFFDNNNDPRPTVDGLSQGELTQGIFNHGTIVAGIIGAEGDNGRDGVGINWHVTLMNVKVLGNKGTGDLVPLADAIYYAVDNGANIINISMVGDGEIPPIRQAIQYAYEHNVVVVAAAGNSLLDLNAHPEYPICADAHDTTQTIIGVSAINQESYLATFSNYGSDCVDITAPGVGIQSTLRYSPTNGLTDTYSVDTTWQGTSFSAPFVSGAAALLKSMGPGFSAKHIMTLLEGTTQHTPAKDETVYANAYGNGLLKIDRAVKAAQADLSQTTETPKPTEPSYPVSTKNTDVLFIAPKTGDYEYRNTGTTASDPKYRATFTQILDVDTYRVNGVTNVAAIYTDAGKNFITIYDARMRLVHQFPVSSFDAGAIAVGDMGGTEDFEYAIAYQHGTTITLELYDNAGELLSWDDIPDISEPAYVSLDTQYAPEAMLDDIVVSYTQGNTTYISRYDDSLSQLATFSIPHIAGTSLNVYDIDTDNMDEYILGAAPGHQPYVYIFDTAGNEESRFRAYAPGILSGVDVAFIDYDNNGSVDVVTTPHDGDAPVSMRTRSGDFVESWWPFDREDLGRVFVLGL